MFNKYKDISLIMEKVSISKEYIQKLDKKSKEFKSRINTMQDRNKEYLDIEQILTDCKENIDSIKDIDKGKYNKIKECYDFLKDMYDVSMGYFKIINKAIN